MSERAFAFADTYFAPFDSLFAGGNHDFFHDRPPVGYREPWYKEKHTLRAEQVVKLPYEENTMTEAAIAFIVSFPLAAVRKTCLEFGESAIVMVLGLLGQIAVKLLRLSGVGAGLNGIPDCMAQFGRVALLGCSRSSDFTVDYYHKVHFPGISLIGAHTCARPTVESHPGYFTHNDDITAILKMCAMGRLDLASMIKEIHTPDECGEVYTRLASDKNFPILVQFDWRGV